MSAKNARVDIKTTNDAKALMENAARAMGTTLSAFILDSSMVRAREILAQLHLVELNESEGQRFVHALENPPKPNQKLQALFIKFDSKNHQEH